MRPTMCFYNHCLDGESLTAVVAFPFTPKIIMDLNEHQLAAFAKFYKFNTKSEFAS